MNGEKLVSLAEGHITALRSLLPEIKAASQNDGEISRDQYSRLFLNVRGLTESAPGDDTEEVEVEEHDEATGTKRKVKKTVAKKSHAKK